MQYNAMQCNTLQYNEMQYNTMYIYMHSELLQPNYCNGIKYHNI
jgi:hypothetical protein